MLRSGEPSDGQVDVFARFIIAAHGTQIRTRCSGIASVRKSLRISYPIAIALTDLMCSSEFHALSAFNPDCVPEVGNAFGFVRTGAPARTSQRVRTGAPARTPQRVRGHLSGCARGSPAQTRVAVRRNTARGGAPPWRNWPKPARARLARGPARKMRTPALQQFAQTHRRGIEGAVREGSRGLFQTHESAPAA
jgi:hypothetical protein